MKKFHVLLSILLTALLLLSFTGCGGGSTATSATTGTVALSLTDAPIDNEEVTGVYVTFTGLRYQYADKNDSEGNETGWKDITLSEPVTVNLLDLQDGNTTLLNEVELPAGVIDHVRFVLDTKKCFVEMLGDINKTLTIPSGPQTGYKAIGGFTIPAGGRVNVTADFDVRKSLVINKNKNLLNPTIKIIDNVEIGEINGTVSDVNNSSVIIYSYTDGSYSVNNDTNTTPDFADAVSSTKVSDGTYVLPWLATGIYDLVVVEYDSTGTFENIAGYINDVKVSSNTITTLDINGSTLLDTLP